MQENPLQAYNLDRLGIIGMKGCEELAEKVDRHLINFCAKSGIETGSFLIPATCSRFGTGEAKAVISHSVRTYDIYIICDPFNYGVTYKMYGADHPMSPDDHYQDLKRIISALGGKAKRITVIMPMMYEGRQHRRIARESLDAAMMLQELTNMGVDNFITFDAHDSRVQNAIPLKSFENVRPTYQMIKACLRYNSDIILKPDETLIVSPDEGAMGRCMYYSSVLSMDLVMFYKRRDYSRVVNGKNPIVAHQFLGKDINDKNVIVVDDMIASGESLLDVAKELKKRHAKRVIVFSSFGLFTEGVEKFNKAYAEGLIDAVFTTNTVYRRPELKDCEWYHEVDMSKFIGLIIRQLNGDCSISELLTPMKKINRILERYKSGETV